MRSCMECAVYSGALVTSNSSSWRSLHPTVSSSLYWNRETACILINTLVAPDGELFVIPFAKSANTAQHSPVSSVVTPRSYTYLITCRIIHNMPSYKWMTVFLYIGALISLI